MKWVGLLLLVPVCISLFWLSCKGPDKECAAPSAGSKKIINPNGDSELALLMREMFDESIQLKEKIGLKESISLNLEYEKILTAHATEPEKAASPEFKAFAALYLESIQQLKKTGSDSAAFHYTYMVNQCKLCHQALCPGPLVRIEKLDML